VITAFTILGDEGDSVFHRDGIIATDVAVIDLSEQAIADYVASGEWRGKAGAYAIQGIGAAIVREVRGSVTNVIGLPLVEVLEALRAVGAPSARFAAGTAA
jgi:septum formation protein